MRKFFEDTERQFVELSQIIPLDNSPNTYSPRLYSILNFTCGQIENMLRMICDKLELKYENEDFPHYYNALNIQGMLESQKVVYREIKDPIQPFVIRSDNSPDWWKGHNKTKHDLPEGIIEGNIGNTLNALAGLCALHHIAYYTATMQEHLDQLLMKENWYVVSTEVSGMPAFVTPKSFRDGIDAKFFSLSKYHSKYDGAQL
ncbi:MAG: hypothetical protein HY222_03300 [Thaumarchaeota archaeon]|nr:hypothetical protein [Nitrososphaerota archaeon]MBI3641401.1 hypothetical protein [Nitrososphaerota archaeon]